MKEKLMEINDELTRVIQLSPLQDIEEGLPIELLYASVVIQKYQKYATTGYDSSQILGELIRKGEFRRMLRASELGAEHTSDFDIGSYTYERSNIRVSHPDDIFRKEGQYARKIYMLGDAAYGKTTYCIWLLRKWCAAKRKEEMGQENFDQWEKELKKFDFAFLMNFRNVDINQDSVVDMICQDAFESEKGCHGVIRDVLSSDKYKSLIIMDGLDEWSSRKNNKMPKIDVSDNVTCFISMRPWVFPILSDKRYRGRVIKILGLSETGVINVIKNVLINHYKVREHSQKYTDTIDKLENETLGSFMHIPLLVVVCVQICYKAKHIRSSMTSFYAEMLNMLIERANEKHTNEIKPEQTDNRDLDLPKILAVYDHIKNCSSVLLKLGNLAYRNLLTNETNLIFQKIKLENEIGLRNLQFALNVGLISQKEAPSLTTKNVSVHFFHKSIQELLAVIYIVTNKEVGDSFCRHLSDVNVVMNLSNVIMFICGMCPSLGSVISQRVVSVTDSCTKICKSPQRDDTVEKLYKLQVTWFRELRHEQTNLKFYLSYVYLVEESDALTVNGTKELLSDKHVDIKSLFLFFVPTCGERCISNTELNAFLCNEHTNTMSLTMIYINSKSDHKRSVQKICAPNLNTLYLYNITCTPLLSEMTLLRELVLFEVSMGDNRLEIPANIAKIRLSKIKMSVSKWKSFLNSLLDINPKLNVTVELNETNIDVESKAEIESSPDFRISQGSSHCMLDFTRIGKQ